jgi:Fasciclin domain
MLTDVASEYTIYNTLDVAQFFRASEWNLRDLRLSVGDGSDLTLFASINTGWSIFNTDDTTRLAGDEWKPHQLDMLSHMLVQGRWTEQDLKDKYETNGAFNLTSLLNQSIPVDFDSATGFITIAGGDLFFPDIQGVDGYVTSLCRSCRVAMFLSPVYALDLTSRFLIPRFFSSLVHFTDALPLPRSVTHSIYDIANEDPRYTTQITYIDTVYLDSDMKRLLPLTALYAPNEEWEGKKTEMEEIAKKVLKSHMFEKLYWCDRLRNETNVTSLNGQNWLVSVNDDNFPCFEPLDATGVVAAPLKTCITKCDILARNGIVHELDTLMMYEAAETRSPSEFIGSAPNATDLDIPAGQPTVFKRPTSSGATAPASAPDIEPESTEKSSASLWKPARILSALILSCVIFLG